MGQPSQRGLDTQTQVSALEQRMRRSASIVKHLSFERAAANITDAMGAATSDISLWRSTLQSDGAAGYDDAKKRKGRKVYMAVDNLDHLLALVVIPANEQERWQVDELATQVQEITGNSVEVAFVDQSYTDDRPAEDAAAHSIELIVVKLAEPKKGFVLLPNTTTVLRTFGLI